MEKIKIKLNKQENKFIKFGKNKIEVVPFISTQNLIGITDICLQQFDSYVDEPQNFALIKTVFDMLVVHFCTNIHIDGVKTSSKKDSMNVSLDCDARKIENFDNSGIIYFIKALIKNYDDCYAILLKTFEMRNIYNALNSLSTNLPNVETLSDGLKSAFGVFKEYSEKDPDTVKQIIKEVVSSPMREEAKKELTEEKEQKNK